MPVPKKYEALSKMYRVKWTDANGVVHYGDVEYYGDTEAAQRRWDRGLVRVNDAVLPVYNDIPHRLVTEVPYGPIERDEYYRYIEDELEKAQRLSDSVGPGCAVGKLISVGVADGSAWYVITKVNKTTVKIEWRGFCPDHWYDQVLGGGGSFPKRVIEPLCRGRWGALASRRMTAR